MKVKVTMGERIGWDRGRRRLDGFYRGGGDMKKSEVVEGKL